MRGSLLGMTSILIGCSGVVLPASQPQAGDLAALQAAVQPIRGVVDFGDRASRQVAANMGAIAKGATVSLIDTTTNRTVSTAKTDEAGGFELSFTGGFVPAADTVYILEAVKGLQDNKPGNDAPRVRTLIQSISGQWSSIVAGQVFLDVSTTALAIMQGSYKAAIPPRTGPEIDPLNYIGLIAQPSGDPNIPDTLRGGQAIVNQSIFDQVHGNTWDSITLNQDPVASIQFSNGTFSPNLAGVPGITAVVPNQASVLTDVTIYGKDLAGATKVTFNGAVAFIKLPAPNSLVVTVPAAATSGPVKVTVGTNISNSSTFTVLAGFGGKFTGSQ